ncbi:catechol 2,3-dioxygenase-like lactoylglutathione lyase family enzyme [Maribacter vaceletii]|uniref:Catechol 2,3-dioxygenase-like lactoylglutathione lyase family enzyme n=1 Tax=Maribacter vaceletii TaxID=1206816 RepID=A0A495EEA4_9FLAO|nr:VOC family protein [Maribacter vaceletii]RKR15250.1 catechol 2,3-dioxygenase-like lactoylglutathione lyase family enzyme [Maribacter vaceletii]
MSLLYKRITLCVADLERSLTIYRDILGFTINYIQPSEKDSFSYPVFNIPNEADLNFATMDSPTQERTFALTEIKGVPLPKQEGIHMTASVIKVDDLADVISKIKDLGLKTTDVKTDENDYATFIEQAFIDYDGHLIVLYQLMEKI